MNDMEIEYASVEDSLNIQMRQLLFLKFQI